jgi:hypothetical protein
MPAMPYPPPVDGNGSSISDSDASDAELRGSSPALVATSGVLKFAMYPTTTASACEALVLRRRLGRGCVEDMASGSGDLMTRARNSGVGDFNVTILGSSGGERLPPSSDP